MHDLTIVVTARERRNTLPRVLEYYKDFEGRIILLDGSSSRWKHIDNYDHVEYIHLPNKTWMEKMVTVLKEIDTPYVAKVCDDDLIFLHALPVMVDFLNNNPEYVTVAGQEISLLDSHFEYETVEYILEANLKDHFDDPLDRMNFYWTHFNCKIHSLSKTKTQLEVYQFMLDNPEMYAIRFFDKLWTLIFASRGKLAILPVLSNMRSRESLVMPPFAPAHNAALHEETKYSLSFASDFLNRDLEGLREFIGGVPPEFIKEMHKNFCNKSFKENVYLNLLEDFELKTPTINLDFDKGHPSVVGVAQDRLRDRINNISKHPDHPEDIYPVYKRESLNEIKKMYTLIRNYPL